MKALILLLAATPMAAAAVDRSELPEPGSPREAAAVGLELSEAVKDRCQTTLRQVRDDRGLPRLDRRTARKTAEPNDPLLIAAVDHVIDGCHLLVMKNDISDIRLPPEIGAARPDLIPAS